MSRRIIVAALAFALSCAAFATRGFAQPSASGQGKAVAAKPAPTPPPTPAKWIAPIKGAASIEVIRGQSVRKGTEMVTKLQIKNTSKNGAIALLGVDEYWYNGKNEMVSSNSLKIKKPINPGEVVEVVSSCPWKAGMVQSNFAFTHANGKIDAKSVKKFSEQ
jgi:hypothetical protein